MNIWRRRPLTENPYVRNAFRVTRVPRELLKRRTIVQLIGQTRRVVCSDPTEHAILGAPVTAEELNQAEAIVLDPAQRILEELLAHPAESLPLDRVAKLAEAARQAGAPAEGTVQLAAGVAPPALADELQRCCLVAPSAGPRASASFGALELELGPPFGGAQEH